MSQRKHLIFVFLTLFAVNIAAVAISLQYKGNMRHPELPNHCYYEEYDLTIPFNETAHPTNLKDKCAQFYCREDFVLEIRHCSNVAPNRNCNWKAYDYSKPYPNCCPIVTCKQH